MEEQTPPRTPEQSDLVLSACGVAYNDAVSEIESVVIQGVPIPFASAKLLLRTEQTYLDKDIPDRIFLEQKLGVKPVESESS